MKIYVSTSARATWNHKVRTRKLTTISRAAQSKTPTQSLAYNPRDRAIGDHEDEESAELDLKGLQGRYFFYNDTLGVDTVAILKEAIRSYLPSSKHGISIARNWMQIGYQHAYFRPSLSSHEICSDGTDTKFIPGPEKIWKYRLWAGGSVVRHTQGPIVCNANVKVNLFERASNIRVVNHEGDPSKVFVTIERMFGTFPAGLARAEQLNNYLRFLNTVGSSGVPGFTVMTETEDICFLRDQPASLKDTRTVRTPSDPVFSHTVTPSWLLLFQFSALTHNAHKIHFDREFARQVYGAKDLVVHGPLTQVLMIAFLNSYLRQQSQGCTVVLTPRAIKYTNLLPLYVDEPLTLCCKPTPEFANLPIQQVKSWQVWIQKEAMGGNSCAVKATVDVQAINKNEYMTKGREHPERLAQAESYLHDASKPVEYWSPSWL